MIARREKDAVLFSFSSMECRVLERVLTALIANYQVPPGELDEKTAAVWYSTRGSKNARMSADEKADWVKQLHNVRSARLEVLQKLLEEIHNKPSGPLMLAIPLEKAEALMTALNDHRLLVAARHDVGEAEMDMRTLSALTKLPPAQQTALYEIHFLAYVIEELLRVLQE
jgi:hypothetical protein